LVDLDLAIGVELRAELLRQAGVKNVAARGEQIIDPDAVTSHKVERANFTPAMVDVADAFAFDGNLVLGQPERVLLIPRRPFAVRGHDDAGGVMQHAEGVFNGFVVRTNDGDALLADAITVAILAEKHAVPEALLHAGNLGRQMENARRQKQPFCAVRFLFPFQNKEGVARGDRLYFVVDKPDFVFLGLTPAIFQEFFSGDPLRKTEIVFYDRFPFGHGMAGIDDQCVALRAPEIYGRGQTGDASADDDDLAGVGLVEVGVMDHGGRRVIGHEASLRRMRIGGTCFRTPDSSSRIRG
jgi:hypothetical protein